MKKAKKIVTFLVTFGLLVVGAVALAFLLVSLIVGLKAMIVNVGDALHLRPASVMAADEPMEGVGRVPVAARYLAPACAGEAETARMLETYTDGDSPVPKWYQPDEDMAVEWVASCKQVKESNNEAGSDENIITKLATQQVTHGNETQRTDAGCPDWNLDSTLWGWDGHGMEVWEMDLFARIVYLEFWGTSTACVEAGIDSMLLLWDMGEYGRTMGELLSAQYAPGYYVYSPYAYVWDWDYDAEGLAGIRAMCEERFENGPTWCAPYFRLWYYHEWAVPAYEIDGVYFSVPRR